MKRKGEKKTPAGYTMVEMVVILAIITGISGIVLFSFTGLNEGASLNRSIRELALAIRRAQNMSLAVTQLEVGSPPTSQIPPAVGVRLSTQDPERYFLFADLAPVDNRYTGVGEKIGNTETLFERRVKINRIRGDGGSPHTTVHILFTAPEANITFSDDAGAVIPGEKIEIELISPSGDLVRTITVRLSGQISVK